MSDDWREEAARVLVGLREPGPLGAWGYRAGSAACVEPTALAALALLGCQNGSNPPTAVLEAADWLARIQRPDGALGLSATMAEPGWGTPYGILVWRALDRAPEARKRAADWLLQCKGKTFPREQSARPALGHDPTIVGWPWVQDTHSWVEPTALAVLALRREGRGAQPRVQEGLRLLRDRAVATGGWNSGNKATFGRVLRPQPAPTGLALLALADRRPGGEAVELAVDYLTTALPKVRAAESLGWGLLGLHAWGQAPKEGEAWLAEAFRRVVGRPDAAPRLALLLLASSPRSLEYFDAR